MDRELEAFSKSRNLNRVRPCFSYRNWVSLPIPPPSPWKFRSSGLVGEEIPLRKLVFTQISGFQLVFTRVPWVPSAVHVPLPSVKTYQPFFSGIFRSVRKYISGRNSTNRQTCTERDFSKSDTMDRKNAMIFSWQQMVLCPPPKSEMSTEGDMSPQLKTADRNQISPAFIRAFCTFSVLITGTSL